MEIIKILLVDDSSWDRETPYGVISVVLTRFPDGILYWTHDEKPHKAIYMWGKKKNDLFSQISAAQILKVITRSSDDYHGFEDYTFPYKDGDI